MPRAWTIAGLSLIAGLVSARTSAAQDSRLERRLDPETRAAIGAIIDSTRAAGLPTEPLVDRALEGAAKHAAAARIVAAVRRLAAELATARASLGASSSPAELDAGASALRAGVRSEDLTALRRRRPRSLTVALATLTDLVASGVPPDSAAAAVLAIAGSARDEELTDFRRNVERDIALGAPPGTAAAVRVNSEVKSFSTDAGSPRDANPPRKP